MKGYTAEAFLSLGSSSSFQGTTESETAQDAKKEIITLTNKGVRCHAVTPLGLSLTHNMSPVGYVHGSLASKCFLVLFTATLATRPMH